MVLSSGTGNAQPTQSVAAQPDEAAAHEVVIVYAPYVVTRTVISPMMSKTSATGLEVVSASRSVSFSDLNLSQPPDEATLESRVYQAAHDACKDIDERFPKSVYKPVPENQDCAGNAANQAMVIVKDLENAAAIHVPIPQ